MYSKLKKTLFGQLFPPDILSVACGNLPYVTKSIFLIENVSGSFLSQTKRICM